MALWGEPGAMIDGMYTLTTDAIYIVRSQCTSNSAAT